MRLLQLDLVFIQLSMICEVADHIMVFFYIVHCTDMTFICEKMTLNNLKKASWVAQSICIFGCAKKSANQMIRAKYLSKCNHFGDSKFYSSKINQFIKSDLYGCLEVIQSQSVIYVIQKLISYLSLKIGLFWWP